MNMNQALDFIVPTLILVIAAVSDVRTKKVKNQLVLAMLAAALVYHFVFHGLTNFMDLGLAVGIAIGMTLPMVLARALGAADMKVLVAFAPAVGFFEVFWTFAFSLIWAVVLGLLMAFLRKELKAVLLNTARLATKNRPTVQQLHKIPFTVPILLGWLSVVVMQSLSRGWS